MKGYLEKLDLGHLLVSRQVPAISLSHCPAMSNEKWQVHLEENKSFLEDIFKKHLGEDMLKTRFYCCFNPLIFAKCFLGFLGNQFKIKVNSWTHMGHAVWAS